MFYAIVFAEVKMKSFSKILLGLACAVLGVVLG